MLAPGAAAKACFAHDKVILRGALNIRQARCKPVQCTPNIDKLLEIEAPEIAGEMQSMQEKLGATFQDGVPLSFGEDSDRRASEAWQHGVVLVDRSHWGRLRLSGDGRKEFLHGHSTADINRLQPGQFCESAFCTPTGRTMDVATVLCQESGFMAVVSPGQEVLLRERLDKHIFPMDKVQVGDITPRTKMFTILGPASKETVAAWGSEKVTNLEDGCHTTMAFQGSPVVVFKSSGLGAGVTGWTVIVGEDAAAEFFRKVALQGAIPMGEDVWEKARIFQGIPACGASKELNSDINALEACLDHVVSLEKGCFVGQETLAKVSNNKGVKVGFATSVATLEGTTWALAYLKSKVEGERIQWEGVQVQVGEALAKVEMPPTLEQYL